MKIEQALNIDDLRRLAKARLPRMVFDYIDGGAEDEIALQRNRDAFENAHLTGRVLRDVSTISTKTSLLGETLAAPLIIAPTAASRLFHPKGSPFKHERNRPRSDTRPRSYAALHLSHDRDRLPS